jgi:ubiquinone/menaquinone biosynthesis C-methylase UbiE
VVRLAAAAAFTGEVLDAGCGTGENALHIAGVARNAGSGGASGGGRGAGSRGASGGVSVLGVDVAETALAAARAKAAERGLDVEFRAADAFALEGLGRSFRTILDCGLFHTFDAEERPRYVASLARVTAKGGILFVLCFSDEDHTSPHPVTRAELTAGFCARTGWEITELATDRVHTNFREDGAPAWLATITRI